MGDQRRAINSHKELRRPMPFYENVFIARQDVSAAQVEALAESFAGIVTQHGGTVTKREYWGLRNLAYRVKKNRKGHYMLFNLDAPPAAVNELERNMRINEDVLRYLTVRVEALEEGPSAVMQNRDRGERERGDRDRGDRGDRRPRFEREPREGLVPEVEGAEV
jgi:small subunit ribosomal protein S6